jgi:ribosomal protein S18 acetylase RimI-like enzyme
MNQNLKYLDANVEDAELLSSLSYSSKKFWGYSDELMNLWKSDLEINNQYIRENKVVKVFDEDNFLGFFAIKIDEELNAELDHLWLKPENIKRNYGRQIFKHIIENLASEGFSKMTLIAEPNAIGFYQKMNGKAIGKFQSKISGRFLDIYEFQTKSATNG